MSVSTAAVAVDAGVVTADAVGFDASAVSADAEIMDASSVGVDAVVVDATASAVSVGAAPPDLESDFQLETIPPLSPCSSDEGGGTKRPLSPCSSDDDGDGGDGGDGGTTESAATQVARLKAQLQERDATHQGKAPYYS